MGNSQANAATWHDDWETAYSYGTEALALLPRGGHRWCKLISGMFLVTGGAQRHSEFAELVGLFGTTVPAHDARAAYGEAAALLVTMFSSIGQREPARNFLELLQQVGRAEGEPDHAMQGWVKFGQMFYARLFECDPWMNMLLPRQGARHFHAAGDLRNEVILRT